MGTTPLARSNRTGLVRFLNDKGLKLEVDGIEDDHWSNFSTWGKIAPCALGDLVTITVDGQGWIRRLVVDDAAPANQPPATAAPAPKSRKSPTRIRPARRRAGDDPADDYQSDDEIPFPPDLADELDRIGEGMNTPEAVARRAAAALVEPRAIYIQARAAAIQAAAALVVAEPSANRDPASVLAVAEVLLSWVLRAD